MKRIKHRDHGLGTVLLEKADVLTVEFDDGTILKVESNSVSTLSSALADLSKSEWSAPLETALRGLAMALRSTNDQWGVFSRSKVNLLPHQLWVCHRVLSKWPSRWLIADDVGLGKTIEAGLILTPLLSRKRVKRLLIVAPASLVDQWIERLRDMFDIRAVRYHPEVDKPGDDFWNLHSQVVASQHTLRLDRGERWDRLLESEPWDLVLVDEAHHLGADESGGRTLGLRLFEEMEERGIIKSLLLFTGTPHRGKDYGFLALLRLVDNTIDPKQALEKYLERLPDLMIRNNKQSVTDMAGERIFQTLSIEDIQYSYTEKEQRFYERLTEFILTGRAYAGDLNLGTQRSVMLVLTTMQKLAASSIAAVRQALRRRLARLRNESNEKELKSSEVDKLWRELERDDDLVDADRKRFLEESIHKLMSSIQLNPEEIPALEELIDLASEVPCESRVERILELIENFAPDTSVLLFTEYKATQALVVGAIMGRYGIDCVDFINGDGLLKQVEHPNGEVLDLTSERKLAAARFNDKSIRFLVSTEAAGEGIDLQKSCHTLIHVDLPWNPMRMHQRVGRLHRYGQERPVKIYVLRNPHTVEGRIWECLNNKLERIGTAFTGAMADPEDIRMLVLGMTSPSFHESIASRALSVDPKTFDEWYDSETKEFGGNDIVGVVKALLGSAARFNLSSDIPGIPKVDLPDLLPFIRGAARLCGRRLDEKKDDSSDGVTSYSLRTPQQWIEAHHTIRDAYHFHLQRQLSSERGGPVLLGAGHQLVEVALDDLTGRDVHVATIPELKKPLLMFSVQNETSMQEATMQRLIVGVEKDDEGAWSTLHDWELVRILNTLVIHPDRNVMRASSSLAPNEAELDLEAARIIASDWVKGEDFPFARPVAELALVLWPDKSEKN